MFLNILIIAAPSKKEGSGPLNPKKKSVCCCHIPCAGGHPGGEDGRVLGARRGRTHSRAHGAEHERLLEKPVCGEGRGHSGIFVGGWGVPGEEQLLPKLRVAFIGVQIFCTAYASKS